MVLFVAPWCKPCNELKRWMGERDIYLDVCDIDQDYDRAAKHKITKVPTLVVKGKHYKGRENIKPYLEANYDK